MKPSSPWTFVVWRTASRPDFAKSYAALGVWQNGSARTLVKLASGTVIPGPVIASNRLWLKSVWGLDGLSQFSFSLDGVTCTNCGPPYQMGWGNYRGDRIGLYSYNDKMDAGYLDVDYFHYVHAGPGK